MKTVVTLEFASAKEAAEALAKLEGVSVVGPGQNDDAAREEHQEKKKRGRKPKQEEPEAEAEEEIEEVEEEETSEEEEDFSEEVEEDADGDDFIDDDQVIELKKALKAFSDKNSKQAAVKTLIKFAKTSKEVRKKDFQKLLAALKIKK